MLSKFFKKTTVQYDSVLDHMEELSEAEASSVVGGADDRYLLEFNGELATKLVGDYEREDVVNLRLKRVLGS